MFFPLFSLGASEIILVPGIVDWSADHVIPDALRHKIPLSSPFGKGERGGFHRGEAVVPIGPPSREMVVSEGIREISETYKLFARSFSDESLVTDPRHVEFLIDKQGYIRARWLPAENDAWRKIDRLMSQVELLRKEKPRAPAPDEHVH